MKRAVALASLVGVVAAFTPAVVHGYDGHRHLERGFEFGGPNGDGFTAVSLVGDAAYVVGWENGITAGDPEHPWNHGVVAKYNVRGGLSWSHPVETAGNDYLQDVAASDQGAVAVGSTSGAFYGMPNEGSYDALISWYQPGGRLGWRSLFGTPAEDSLEAVAVLDGEVFAAGYTHGSLDGPSAGDSDVIVRKYDLTGQLLWSTQFGGPTSDAAFALDATSDGLFVAGDTGAVSAPTSTGDDQDGFVARLDPASGDVLWQTTVGTSAYDDVQAMATDGGRVYVGAGTTGDIRGSTPTDSGGRDAWLVALDTAGTQLWSRQIDVDGQVDIGGVSAVAPGVVVSGSVFGELDGATRHGHDDAFLRAYSRSGRLGTTQQLGETGESESTGSSDIDGGPGGIVVVGATNSPWFEGGGGGGDAFIAHLARHQPELTASSRHPSVPAGTSTTVRIAVRNGGEVSERFVLKGCDRLDGVELRVFDGAQDVTTRFVAARYRTSTLAPGDREVLTLRFRAERDGVAGTTSCRLTTRSERGAHDTVSMRVDVR